MPRGDGTGPRGTGPGSGRGLGGCRMRVADGGAPVGGASDLPPAGWQASRARGSNTPGRPAGRGSGMGEVLGEMLFSWFERVTRKYQEPTKPNPKK